MSNSYISPGNRRSGPLGRVLSLQDFERLARRRLPAPIYGYISGAAEENRSLDANRTVFEDYEFLPRVFQGVAGRSTRTELFGTKWEAPFGVAPMGSSAIAAYRADIQIAKAAQEAGIPAVLSGSSLIPMEDVAAAAPQTWFQAYLPSELAEIEALLERAERAGFRVLVLTGDVPVMGNRENLIRAGFSTPLRPSARLIAQGLAKPRWLIETFARTLIKHGMPHFENSSAVRGAPIVSREVLRDFSHHEHLSWRQIAHIRKIWPGKLVIKGVLSPADAEISKSEGADGIVVSNHGGRQLDGAVPPLRVLPQIVERVGDLPVIMDSGVRRGTDVLKALALGAHFVFVGRPFVYAAAVAGSEGVAHAIAILKTEIDRNLGLLGLTDIKDVSEDVLFRIKQL